MKLDLHVCLFMFGRFFSLVACSNGATALPHSLSSLWRGLRLNCSEGKKKKKVLPESFHPQESRLFCFLIENMKGKHVRGQEEKKKRAVVRHGFSFLMHDAWSGGAHTVRRPETDAMWILLAKQNGRCALRQAWRMSRREVLAWTEGLAHKPSAKFTKLYVSKWK